MNTVYPRIKSLREEAGLSQRKFVKEIDMQYTTYVRYEMGMREIPFNIAIKLAQYYGVSLDYLAGLTDDRTPQ